MFRGRHGSVASVEHEGGHAVPQRLTALVGAWNGDGDVSDAVWEVGSLYALDGESLRVLLDDVDRARTALRLAGADVALVRALAMAWSEAAMGRYARLTCTDPLTGLATAQHLQTQVVTLSRRRESDGWALVVVEIGAAVTRTYAVPAGMFELIGLPHVAAVVEGVMTTDVTVARLAPRRCAALVPREDVTALVTRFDSQIREQLGATRTWVERLPADPTRASALIDELCR